MMEMIAWCSDLTMGKGQDPQLLFEYQPRKVSLDLKTRYTTESAVYARLERKVATAIGSLPLNLNRIHGGLLHTRSRDS